MIKYYPKPEFSIVMLIILGIILLIMPFSIENTRQANFISKWNEKYNRIEYMFSVINAHITNDMLKSMKNAKTQDERERILLTIIKPYLRINIEKTPSRHYKPHFQNGSRINKNNLYYFEDFYFAENNAIVGIKEYDTKTKQDPMFIMMFDMNGILPPNRWGEDIFGINIFDKGKIEPFGFEKPMDELKTDCSKTGTGVSCSYYYIIGGGFDD